jgi:hypothetical protein
VNPAAAADLAWHGTVRNRQGKIISGSAGWVFVVQVLPECGRIVQALGFKDVGDVATGEDDDGVGVFADFGVGLGVEV